MDEKKTGDSGYFMDESRGGGAISSNENALFFLWFYLINLHCLGVGVCENNQGITGTEKANRADRVDRVDGSRADRADRVYGVDKGGVNVKEPDGIDGIDGANRADGVDRADGTNGADGADRANRVDEADRADGANGGEANVEKLGDSRDPGLGDS